MLQVPKPLKTLFDTFPLATYGPVANTTPQNDAYIEASKYCFETKDSKNGKDSSDPSDSVFTLGAHNVVPLHISNTLRYVPSDPVSFGLALVLCRKNGLLLPQGKGTLNHSIMNLAYHASPDNQLPLLIEDEKETRNLRSGTSVGASVASKYFAESTVDYMVNNLIEHELYDLWLMALLIELPSMPEKFNSIFSHKEEITRNEAATTATLISLLLEIPSWRALKVRYPHLLHESKSAVAIRIPRNVLKGSLVQAFSTADSSALERTYHDKLETLKTTLHLLVSYVHENPNDIVKLKLVAYIVSVDSLLRETKLGQLISKKFEDLVKYSYNTIEKEF